jgi:RNA polymerase sigma-70 factor (ECF subfamily)
MRAEAPVVREPRADEPKLEDPGATMLALHIQGDPHAFEQLVQHYGRSIYGYLLKSGIDRPTADDLFQETFLRVHRAAGQYDDANPFRAWLFTICGNLLRSHWRKKKVRRIMLPWTRKRSSTDNHGDPPEMDPPDKSAPADERVAARQRMQLIEQQLDHLPAGPRQALLLTRVEGLSLEEAAQALDVPLGTVKTWVRKARLELATALTRLDEGVES